MLSRAKSATQRSLSKDTDDSADKLIVHKNVSIFFYDVAIYVASFKQDFYQS